MSVMKKYVSSAGTKKGENIMKKGKIIGKRQIVLATLVLCLGAAVWLNMKYASFDEKKKSGTLGEAQYVNTSSETSDAVPTSGGVDYIASARKERSDVRDQTIEKLKEVLSSADIGEKSKNDALKGLDAIAENAQNEISVEAVIKAKGFSDAFVMISEDQITVMVPGETLLPSETLQIQDAVMSQLRADLEKIKIITVK